MNIICTTSGSVQTCDYSSFAASIWLLQFLGAFVIFFTVLFTVNYFIRKII